MTQPRFDDDDPFDEDGVLKDGRSVRVSLMDAMSVREQRPLLHDGHGNPVGHRPGFVVSDAVFNRDERESAYSDYERDLTAAYKTGRPTCVFDPPRARDAITMEEIFAQYVRELRNG